MQTSEIFVQTALKAWQQQISRATKYFDGLNDEQLLKPVAAGKNRVIYLLGHLVAVNDSMISLFGLGERQYAHYDEAFIRNPDNVIKEIPDVQALRKEWKRSNEILHDYFASITPEGWLEKHAAMTEEDRVKEPSRNKLSVLLNRTNHVAYHLGQLMLA